VQITGWLKPPKLLVSQFSSFRTRYYAILICHGLKKPLVEAWPRFKVWD
jgi:hypothetical protein